MYKNKAAFRSDMANRYQAAQTRLAKFLEVGPPTGHSAGTKREHAPEGRPHRKTCGSCRKA